MAWYTMGKELSCAEVPVMDIVREFRALATGSRYAHRGQQPPEYGCIHLIAGIKKPVAVVSVPSFLSPARPGRYHFLSFLSPDGELLLVTAMQMKKATKLRVPRQR